MNFTHSVSTRNSDYIYLFIDGERHILKWDPYKNARKIINDFLHIRKDNFWWEQHPINDLITLELCQEFDDSTQPGGYMIIGKENLS